VTQREVLSTVDLVVTVMCLLCMQVVGLVGGLVTVAITHKNALKKSMVVILMSETHHNAFLEPRRVVVRAR
jgi:hypothetical protein